MLPVLVVTLAVSILCSTGCESCGGGGYAGSQGEGFADSVSGRGDGFREISRDDSPDVHADPTFVNFLQDKARRTTAAEEDRLAGEDSSQESGTTSNVMGGTSQDESTTSKFESMP
jgi:hypothetical protein